MGSAFRSVLFNLREQASSPDLNRAQALGSRALQEELRRAQLDTAGTPISCFSEVPTFAGVAATFNMAIGAGEALVYDVTGIGADDSPYKVIQWIGQNLTFANPDGANPRIDLIVATPATVQADNATRNILLDPVTRAFSPTLVPKTLAPLVVPVVVAGTPGPTPSPPATPAGSFPLYEVLVPASAPDATSFVPVQRMSRRSGVTSLGTLGDEPQSAIIRGCQLVFTSTFAAISQPSGVGIENQVLIEGEALSFRALTSLGNDDSLNPAFGAPAGAGADVPVFLYVCGGRAMPQNSGAYPAILLSSLTPPDVRSGRPQSPLGTPRGNTQSAVYVGLAFKRKSTTSYQICQAVDDMIYFASVTAADPGFEAQTLAAGDNAVTLASAPPDVSTLVRLGIANVTGGLGLFLRGVSMPTSNVLWERVYGGALAADGTVDLPIPGGSGGPHFKALLTVNAVDLQARAYNTNVRRLG